MMLRSFRDSDLDQCVDLFVSTFSQAPWNETWDRSVVRERLDQIVETPNSFGVVIGDPRITGFALGFSEPWHQGSHFYLKEMCVDHARQRQGLGTMLMNYLAEEVRDRGARRIYLLTARGDVSEAFYSKIGFYTSPRMILMAQHLDTNGEDVGGRGSPQP